MAEREERILIELMDGLEKEAKHLGSGFNRPPAWALKPPVGVGGPVAGKPTSPTDINKDGKTNVLDIVKKIKRDKDRKKWRPSKPPIKDALPPMPYRKRPRPNLKDLLGKGKAQPMQPAMRKGASYTRSDVIMEKAAIAG